MFVIRHSILVQAPLDLCFALSTSIEVVHRELHMTAVQGRTSGLVQAGDLICWEGMQLGFRNYHVSQIRHFHPPHFFTDRMLAGRFRAFEHDHSLAQTPEGTLLQDEIRFRMKWGAFGWLLGALILRPHIHRLLRRRFRLIKRLAETEDWRAYIAA